MHGIMLTIYADPLSEVDVTEFNSSVPLEALNKAVAGHIELVPYFNKIEHRGEVHQCVVFCNEEGKLHKLKYNPLATALWKQCVDMDDMLVGDVAVLYGDEEFMEAI
jgi:hypothetical protein